MMVARVPIALACLAVACHRAAPVQENHPVRRVVTERADTARVTVTTPPPALGDERVLGREAGFSFKTPDQRDSLRAVLNRERELWRASAPRDYRYELKVGCFCPGVRGWLTIEVRAGKPLKASDAAGKTVPITDWNTYSIDGLFEHLEGFADRRAGVQVSFDPRGHFPSYVSASFLPGPDMWTVVEARGLRPIPAP